MSGFLFCLHAYFSPLLYQPDLILKSRFAILTVEKILTIYGELTMQTNTHTFSTVSSAANLGCVIMASGLGKRFGGNKLMADFNGEPLLCRALTVTEGYFARRVVVTRHADVAALCRARNIEVILHDRPYRSDTVRLGLSAVTSIGNDINGCLFCPGDQPLLRRKTVEQIIQTFAIDKKAIVRPAFDGIPGAPVLFPRWTFSKLLALPEGKGGGFVAKKYPERVHLVPVRDQYELKDVDTPEDLTYLEDLQHQRHFKQ